MRLKGLLLLLVVFTTALIWEHGFFLPNRMSGDWIAASRLIGAYRLISVSVLVPDKNRSLPVPPLLLDRGRMTITKEGEWTQVVHSGGKLLVSESEIERVESASLMRVRISDQAVWIHMQLMSDTLVTFVANRPVNPDQVQKTTWVKIGDKPLPLLTKPPLLSTSTPSPESFAWEKIRQWGWKGEISGEKKALIRHFESI